MIELSNSIAQTVTAGSNVLYDTQVVKSGCVEKHRAGSGQILLSGAGRYLVTFSGNIAVPDGVTPVGQISLGISQQGEVLNQTVMIQTPTADATYFNVSAQTYIDVYNNCSGGVCCQTIAVENNGTSSLEVINPNFTAVRVNGR